MERLPAVAVLGLAGGGICGVAQAGFDVVGWKAGADGFGVALAEENRQHLPGGWETQRGEWDPEEGVGLVAAIPPCSGFSLANTRKTGMSRGIDSPINDCMWQVVEYAARCTGLDSGRGPEVVLFESVQPAGRAGRPLMQALRGRLEERTGQQYGLTHLFMSGSSVGAAQRRQRYFFVAHRVPFGIEVPARRAEVSYGDSLADLQGLEDTWEAQPYRYPAGSRFQAAHRTPSGGVTAHTWAAGSWRRQVETLVGGSGWEPGKSIRDVVEARWAAGEEHGWKRAHEDGRPRFGNVPPAFRVTKEHYGRVLLQCGGTRYVHWREPRCLTVRECARLMGLPDSWTFESTRQSVSKAHLWLGKNVPVESYRWAAGWARAALLEAPGPRVGEEVGDRERLIDVTHAWRAGGRIIA